MNLYINFCIMVATLLKVAFSVEDSHMYNVYSQPVPNDITIIGPPLSNSSIETNDDFLEISENCTLALEMFTEKVTNLTRCFVLNARPIHLCVNCEDNFNATKEAYDSLRKESSPCIKFYFEGDQIGIINQIYSQGRDLWAKNSCQNCQAHMNNTVEFFDTSRNLEICIKNSNESSKGLNNTCDMCQELFVKMNYIYKEFVQTISNDETGGVCMDIVDQMNITRHMWTKQNCLRFDSNVGYPNIITAVLVGAMPVFFYMLSKNISIIEDVKLVRPKRKSFASLPSESVSCEDQ